jgi:hypothetical protein
MGWPSSRQQRRSGEPDELAERLRGRGLFRIDRDVVRLDDRTTVQRWLRELSRNPRDTVYIHRSWGTVAALAGRRRPVGVFLADGDDSWRAAPPGAGPGVELTQEQIEQVVLDALAAPIRPHWPDWRPLTR